MRSAFSTALVALAIVPFLTSSRATALEVFGNEGFGNTGPNIRTGSPAIGFYGPQLAQGFRTGSTEYDIASVTMTMNFATDPTSYFSLGLYTSTDQSGLQVPGTLVGSFDTNVSYTINSPTTYTFDYIGSQTLGINTNYWVVVSNSTSTSFSWYYSSDGSGSGVAPVERNDSGYAPIPGGISTVGKPGASATWANATALQGVTFRLNVVPEPSTYALAAVGTLTLGLVARRKTRKPAIV